MALLPACSDEPSSGAGTISIDESSLSGDFVQTSHWTYPLESGENCTLWPPEVPAHPSNRVVTAGVLTVKLNDRTFVIKPVVDWIYDYEIYSYEPEMPVFASGDTVKLSFSGGAAPAFSTGELVLPLPVEVTQPRIDWDLNSPPDEFVPPAIVRAEDLQLAWSGGSAEAYVGVFLRDKDTKSISCSFQVSAGAGSIPASMLAQLAPSDVPTDSHIWVSTRVADCTYAGDWRLSTEAMFGLRQSPVTLR